MKLGLQSKCERKNIFVCGLKGSRAKTKLIGRDMLKQKPAGHCGGAGNSGTPLKPKTRLMAAKVHALKFEHMGEEKYRLPMTRTPRLNMHCKGSAQCFDLKNTITVPVE